MTDGTKRLITLGRWVVLATQVWLCVLVLLVALTAAHSIAIGGVRLQLDEPWDSALFYALCIPHIVVAVCWGLFCLFFAVLLRRRQKAGSLKQIAAIMAVLVPFQGIRYYDRTIRALME